MTHNVVLGQWTVGPNGKWSPSYCRRSSRESSIGRCGVFGYGESVWWSEWWTRREGLSAYRRMGAKEGCTVKSFKNSLYNNIFTGFHWTNSECQAGRVRRVGAGRRFGSCIAKKSCIPFIGPQDKFHCKALSCKPNGELPILPSHISCFLTSPFTLVLETGFPIGTFLVECQPQFSYSHPMTNCYSLAFRAWRMLYILLNEAAGCTYVP